MTSSIIDIIVLLVLTPMAVKLGNKELINKLEFILFCICTLGIYYCVGDLILSFFK